MEIREITVHRLFQFTSPHQPYELYMRQPDDGDKVVIRRVAYFDKHEKQWIFATGAEDQDCNPYATAATGSDIVM